MTKRTIAPIAGLTLFAAACGGARDSAPPPAAPEPVTFPATAPEPLPVEDVNFPDYTERTLRNGARLLVVENHEQPVVSIQLLVPGGSAADPDGMSGLASITASLLDKGTETMTAAELAEEADFIGARLGAGASSEWSSVFLTTITDFLDRGLELMSDIVLEPTFPQDELDVEKRRRISSLRLARSQPGPLAAETFAREVYGPHPYGQTETAETIEAVETDDLERFHQTWYRPSDALFVVAGDVDPDRIVRRLELAFSGWQGESPQRDARPEPPSRTGRDMVFVHKPGSVQAVVRIGHLFPTATGADWVPLDVANQVLGDREAAFTAWMMSILREEKGYTYGAYSDMSERRGPGTFIMQGEYRNEVADSALAIMLDLAGRLRSGDIPPEDLARARSYLTGSFPLDIETPQEVAQQIASNRLLGREEGYLEEYRSRIAAVDAEDVARAARQHIHPDDMLIVVVGDATVVLDDLRPFADDVRVVDTEGRPVDLERVAAAADAAADVTFDASRLQPRTMTYGVRFQGNQIGTVTTSWSRDGESFVSVTEQALPGMSITQTTTFDARDFAPRSVTLNAGAMGEFALTVDEGRATGRALDIQTRQPKDVDVAVPNGAALEGMVDIAMALNSYDDVGAFTLSVLTGAGEIQAQTVSVVAEETVEVPAGTFETYKLEITGAQIPSTAWVTKTDPHIVVRREVAGQPVEVVLTSMK